MKNKVFVASISTLLILIAILIGCNDKDGLHKGTFSNRTRQQANDLHIVFSEEGVTYDASESKTRMASHTPINENGKTIINLDGDINSGGAAFGLVFKRKKGDFKVEKWWWTIKKDGESVPLGAIHYGPPNKDDGSGDWK